MYLIWSYEICSIITPILQRLKMINPPAQGHTAGKAGGQVSFRII